MGLNLCFVMHFGCLKVYHFVLGYVSLFSSFPSSSPYLLKTDFCTWAVLLVAEWIPGSRENSLTILDSMTSWDREMVPSVTQMDQSRKLCILLSFLKCGYAYGFCPWATNPGLKILKLKMSKWFATENLLLLYIYISISWGKKIENL